MARGRGIPSHQQTDAARGRGRGRSRGRAQAVASPPQHIRDAHQPQQMAVAHPSQRMAVASPPPYHIRGMSSSGPSSTSTSFSQRSTPSPSAAVPSPEMVGQFHTPSPQIPIPPHPQDAVHEDADEVMDDMQEQPQEEQGDVRPFLTLKQGAKMKE